MRFFGGFGRMLGVANSEDSLTHPSGISNFVGNISLFEDSITNQSFLNEFQKTLDTDRSLGYNMDEFFDWVKEIIQGHVNG